MLNDGISIGAFVAVNLHGNHIISQFSFYSVHFRLKHSKSYRPQYLQRPQSQVKPQASRNAVYDTTIMTQIKEWATSRYITPGLL